MKRISANFYIKDFSSRLSMDATIRRLERDGQGQEFGDLRTGHLDPIEMSRDDIVIRVFDGKRSSVVAHCHATLSSVAPSVGVQMNTETFPSGRMAGLKYASMQLNMDKNTYSKYDEAHNTVLIIESIEVMDGYKMEGIGSSILDFLIKTVSPDYVTVTLCSCYMPSVKTNSIVPAETDLTAMFHFLKALHFTNLGKINVDNAGTVMPLSFFVVRI